MTNLNVLILAEILKSEIDNIKKLQGAKLSYAIIKNIDIINNHVNTIKSLIETSEEYINYEKDRNDLCIKYCKKNNLNELITITKEDGSQEYDIDINNDNWINEMNALKNKYEKCIQDRNIQIEKYNYFLNQNAEIELYKFPLEDVPDNVNVEMMDIIKNFIIE